MAIMIIILLGLGEIGGRGQLYVWIIRKTLTMFYIFYNSFEMFLLDFVKVYRIF